LAQNTVSRWSRPKLILFVSDLSESAKAILYATSQAKLNGAKVLLVHFIPSHLQAAAGGLGTGSLSSEFGTVRAKMDQVANEIQREGLLCESVVLNGLPAEQLPALVKSRGVDRVIVATRILGGVERMQEGSVAEDLMVSLEVPVFTIGPHAHPFTVSDARPRQVLLATSFRAGSSVCTGFASTFAELYEGQLTMLHVLDVGGMSKYQKEKARDATRQRLSAYIPGEVNLRHPPVIAIHEGDPATAILERAGSSSDDLIVLGSPSSSVVSRILTGNVVHQVVTEARCPVVTIKPTASTVRDVIRETFDREYHLHY